MLEMLDLLLFYLLMEKEVKQLLLIKTVMEDFLQLHQKLLLLKLSQDGVEKAENKENVLLL